MREGEIPVFYGEITNEGLEERISRMKARLIPVFYREITNEGRQLPPFVCYLLLPRFGGEYGLVNSRSFMSCFLDISLSCRDCGFSPYRCFQFLRLS